MNTDFDGLKRLAFLDTFKKTGDIHEQQVTSLGAQRWLIGALPLHRACLGPIPERSMAEQGDPFCGAVCTRGHQ
jgi:hypothetical protein